MNQTTLVQIAERLEGLASKLPERIRRPVLRELIPLKQLFLQQRRPRFLFIGSSKRPMPEIIDVLFAPDSHEGMNVTLTPVHRWTEWTIPGHGTVSILDARDAGNSAEAQIQDDLRREPADVVFFFDDGESNLNEPVDAPPGVRDRLLTVVRITERQSAETRRLMSLLAAELPNQAKIEMIRISRDRHAQLHVAQMLIKSTTAICAAIGAQPIPLADLPVLTVLQVLMVSGIMYISGRERSLRAATEFIAALGANVGVGMLLREGARAMLKFFPGWGNVVCGMVAGAGTYAIGRAATAYFLEGASLKEAKQTYLKSRRKRSPRALPSHE